MAKWTDDQIRAAALIAKATNWKEAAENAGIPYMTLRRRAKDLVEKERKHKPKPGARKLERLQQEAQTKAVEKATNYIYDRIKTLADGLYLLAQSSVDQAKGLVESAKLNGTKDEAAWLKALAGTFHSAVQDAQLLSGKPTARQDLNVTPQHKITAKLVEENPDLLDTIFPEPEIPLEVEPDGDTELH